MQGQQPERKLCSRRLAYSPAQGRDAVAQGPQPPQPPQHPPPSPRRSITYYLNCTWYTTGPTSWLSDPGSQLRTCSVL